MCGIVGYVGDGDAAAFLLEGLSRLEYRGYDSSGIAVYDGEKICVKKSVGRLAELKIKLAGHTPKGALGIGHTRWATTIALFPKKKKSLGSVWMKSGECSGETSIK
ncbi:MAG: hypothetical protein ACFNUI_08705, partial [Negativicutes bacterium]